MRKFKPKPGWGVPPDDGREGEIEPGLRIRNRGRSTAQMLAGNEVHSMAPGEKRELPHLPSHSYRFRGDTSHLVVENGADEALHVGETRLEPGSAMRIPRPDDEMDPLSDAYLMHPLGVEIRRAGDR